MRQASGVVAIALVAVLFASGCGGGKKAVSPTESANRGSLGVPHKLSSSRVQANFVRLAAAVKPPGSTNLAKYLPSRNVKTMGQYLTRVLNRVDAYWTQQFEASGLQDPYVRYDWLTPGQSVDTGCGDTTDDDTAEYCSVDDTIYISTQFAYNFWKGILTGRAPCQCKPGDFGVAYVVAHEYGHNVQAELGIQSHGSTVSQLELQADCFAGVFANSEYWTGEVEGNDVQKAVGSADLVGDYDDLAPSHHGHPAERIAAWKTGYNSGDPDQCLSTFNP
jgi:uncharacterized protein